MALSAKNDYVTVGATRLLPVKAAGNETLYKGAYVVLDANGYAAKPTDAAALPPVGVITGKGFLNPGDDSYAVPNLSHPDLEVEQGLIWCSKADAAQTDVGTLLYVADDGTLAAAAGNKTIAFYVLAFKTGYVLLDFCHPIKVA